MASLSTYYKLSIFIDLGIMNLSFSIDMFLPNTGELTVITMALKLFNSAFFINYLVISLFLKINN